MAHPHPIPHLTTSSTDICWVGFDWGEGADPQGNATRPLWEQACCRPPADGTPASGRHGLRACPRQVSARELYDHDGDTGDEASRESFEWDNVAHLKEHAALVQQLHAQLVDAVEAGVVKPVSGRRA